MNASWRNIVIFVGGAYALSTIGCLLVARGRDVGGLIFIIGPVLMATLLRTVTRDGWRTAGLRLNLHGHRFEYALAFLFFPVLVGVSLGFGGAIGSLTISDDFMARYLPAALAMLPITMINAVCEEFGWRGYLEPQLEILGVPDFRRYISVGVIWTLWHIPYLMTFGNPADMPLVLLIPIYLIATLAMAVWYGVVRKTTNSVWPAVVAHGGANAIMWPLIVGGMVEIHNPIWISPRPTSAFSMVMLIVLAAYVWRRRAG